MQANQNPASISEEENAPFTVHWAAINDPVARRYADAKHELFALWPAPVNSDACFAEAGFRDFDDADQEWERNADGVLSRLMVELDAYGTPRLLSSPLHRPQSWLRRWFSQPEALDLRQQIELPMHWDNLPDCLLEFGESKVTLRTGKGHQIYWVGLPKSQAAAFPEMAGRIAATHPLIRTDLRWDCLIR